MSNAGFWKIDVKKYVFMAMAQRKTIVDGEKKKSTKKFGRKNLNSTHFKTFVKNHVKKNETEEVIIGQVQYSWSFGCLISKMEIATKEDGVH